MIQAPYVEDNDGEVKWIKEKKWGFTWYGDDWYILIGHHPWRAAFLHVEVSCLEKSPTGKREKNTTVSVKSIRESLAHCSQSPSVNSILYQSDPAEWRSGERRESANENPRVSRTQLAARGAARENSRRELLGKGKQRTAAHRATANSALYLDWPYPNTDILCRSPHTSFKNPHSPRGQPNQLKSSQQMLRNAPVIKLKTCIDTFHYRGQVEFLTFFLFLHKMLARCLSNFTQ